MEQAASDLEENRRRQQELSEEIKMLRQEEVLLVDILNIAERFEGSPDAAPATQQAPEGTGPTPAAAADGAAPQRAARAKGAGPRSGKNAARTGAKGSAKGKPGQPLLGDIFLTLLSGHDEPRLAKELREELLERHPGRTPTPQVVRNTLESLVAKGRIQRHKQQRSVMYSVVEPDAPEAAPAADTPESDG
ncbi:hypothetical protein ACIQGZ_28300 [Streptomyces sp. NPDC092296]|uniref:hypothetical protein n=1 Tax=Streptomyces sp. NPDC092296 TaxID=3366012 RepID=UPI0037FE0E44